MRGKYSLVRQNDRGDCGAAALATLAMHYQMPVALERMRDLADCNRDGASLLGLLRAAEKLGFSAKAVRLTNYEMIHDLPLPVVAHVADEHGNGHFVVVHRVTKRQVVVADPARAVERRSHDEFRSQWSGNVLLAAPDKSLTHVATANRSTTPLARFVQLLTAHSAILVEIIACALAMTLLAVSTSYFVQHLVDSVLARGERPLLNALGIGMVLVMAFRALFNGVRQYLVAHIGRQVDLMIVGSYARHVQRLPMRFFENRRVGDIFSRVTDAAKLREAVYGAATTAVVDTIVVVGLLVVLWFYDAPLAAATSLVVPLFLAAVAVHHPAVRRHVQHTMEHGAELSSHLIEDFSGVETFKAFSSEELRSEQCERRLVNFAQSLFTLQKLDVRLSSLAMFITGVAGVAILWYGGHRVLAGALSIGQLLFFYTLLVTMLEPLNRLATVNLKIQDALVAIDRLFQVLDIEQEPFGADKVNFESLQDGIELQGVGFGYGSRGDVLSNVSLKIPAGKTVAIVGESGSGKSTLLKLLLNFHQPTAGRIFLDGVDLRDFELHSYRSRVGVVSQDPFIFNGSIRDNIALARPDASLADVIEVARAAGLDEFISSLPGRYDTLIGERGANLSGGQRQRLAIARALLHAPEVLIFDEATSHLDTTTERVIQHSLKTRLAGRTVIVVAHRLSTIKDADMIYVLDGGQVCEQGTHHDLLARDGNYAALWDAQVGARDADCRCHGRLPLSAGALRSAL